MTSLAKYLAVKIVRSGTTSRRLRRLANKCSAYVFAKTGLVCVCGDWVAPRPAY